MPADYIEILQAIAAGAAWEHKVDGPLYGRSNDTQGSCKMTVQQYAEFIAALAAGKHWQHFDAGHWYTGGSTIVPGFEEFSSGRIRLQPEPPEFSKPHYLIVREADGLLTLCAQPAPLPVGSHVVGKDDVMWVDGGFVVRCR